MHSRLSWLLFLAAAFSGWSAVIAAAPTTTSASHWAFQPVRKPLLPNGARSGWERSPIDRFVQAGLDQAGLQPSPVAERGALLRRATFDLTGLPPTPEEVAAFHRDQAPLEVAFAKVIERLLGSPRYGERWGRHWLDVARYADNKGYVFFEEKTHPWAWTYRDYVVRAFNDNKRFDQFILEQIAADLISPGNRDALRGLGFITVGDHFINNTHDILDDRIDVVTRGLLGLTVGCARCHDHKFDPISMADYYALYGVFRSSSEPVIPPVAEAPELNERFEGFELELLAKKRKLMDFVSGKHREIVEGGRTRVADYLMAVHAQRHQPATENFMLIADKGDLNPAVVSRWRTHIERAGRSNPIWAPWIAFAELEDSQFATSASAAHEALKHETSLNPLVRTALLNPAAPKTMKEVAERYAGLFKRVEQSSTNAVRDPDELALRAILYGPDAPPDIPAQADWGFLTLLPDRASQGEFQKLISDLEQWLMKGPEAPPRAMALQDLPIPYEPRIFIRGNPNRPGEKVPRRFLSIIDPAQKPFTNGSGRAELAAAVADPKNPLTARVFVNRVWMHHFGSGLVNTPGDFGTRGEAPSNQALLDWLAAEFMHEGWNIKSLHRLIMNSSVYQQSSAVPAGSPGRRVDPENRLLWRMNPRRHDFETLRDSLLAASGRLNLLVGGPPVASTSPRRTVYTFVDRLDLPPVFATFDFPSPSTSCPQRSQTTVAPQALYLMNNEFAAECAAAVFNRADLKGAVPMDARIQKIHLILFGREATAGEMDQALTFLGSTPEERTWQNYVHALFLSNEFAFVD